MIIIWGQRLILLRFVVRQQNWFSSAVSIKMTNARQLGLSISAETDKLVFGKSDTSHTEKGFYTNKKGQKLFTRSVASAS